MARKHNEANTETASTIEGDIAEETETASTIEGDIAEETETRAVALTGSAYETYLAAAGFTVTKKVTRPLLKLGRTPSIVKFESDWFEGKIIENKAKMGPPTMAIVTDMTTGEECEMIAGEVLVSELTRTYGEHGHVGKIFALAQNHPEGVRRYSLYSITELAPKA